MHPILLRLGPLTISTYGFFVACAYLAAILWLKSRSDRMPGMTEDKFWLLIYGLFFGAIMGGKLLFMALEWRSYASGQLRVIADFRYGFVFFGGLLGALGMGALLTRRLKIPFWATADYCGVALPLGHALGRLGCLGAGCCYGKPTMLPWGIALGGSPASSTPVELWGVPLHPTQLYESAANLAIAAYLARRLLPRVERDELPAGTVLLAYVLLYSVARFLIEFLRGDDRGGTMLGLFVSQWIGLVCALVAAVALARRQSRPRPAVGA
jgi:phosphatidylglycerol:prolipoprotein diacylglycerol transferase